MGSKRTAPRVPFGTLVEIGMIAPGTVVTDVKRRWHATIHADGTLECGGDQGSIHRIGAAVQGAPACNGWTFWHVQEGDSLQPLDILRQRYVLTLD